MLEPTRMAVLDHGLVVRMAPWPQLGLELFARGTRRAHALAVALAIAHHPRVDDRLRLTLWHLAERWARVRPDGIAVPLPLSHQRLADLVGAHRPSVTTAMWDLARSGALSRGDDGVWVLHGAPPSQLRNHRLIAAITARIAIRNRSGWMTTPPATAMINRTTASARSMLTSGLALPTYPRCAGRATGTGTVPTSECGIGRD